MTPRPSSTTALLPRVPGCILAQTSLDEGGQLSGDVSSLRQHVRADDTTVRQLTFTALEVCFSDPTDALRVLLLLIRDDRWCVGVRPRVSAAGDAGWKQALLQRAGSSPSRTATGADETVGRALHDASLALAASVVRRWSDRGLEVALLSLEGLTQEQVGRRLGVSRQAVNQRMRAASWDECREILLQLLVADGPTSGQHHAAGSTP